MTVALTESGARRAGAVLSVHVGFLNAMEEGHYSASAQLLTAYHVLSQDPLSYSGCSVERVSTASGATSTAGTDHRDL